MKTSEKLNRFMVMAGKHDAIWKKYGVNSAPTVLFLDPSGKKVGDGGRDSAGLIKEINEIAEKYNRAPKWAESEEAATGAATKDQKPLVMVYRDDKARSDQAIQEFSLEPLAELYDQAVWITRTLNVKSDEAKALGLTSLPAMWIVDTRIEDPKARILKKVALPKSGASIAKELKTILKSWKKIETSAEGPSEEPAKEEPEQDE